MKPSKVYVKVVVWSNEDGCYVGSAPGLIYGDCQVAVFAELCDIVEEVVALYEADGKPLPPPASASDIATLLTA